MHIVMPHPINANGTLVGNPDSSSDSSFLTSVANGQLNVTDRETLITFAMISAVAHTRVDSSNATNIGSYAMVDPFGWDSPGVKGYVYGTSDIPP